MAIPRHSRESYEAATLLSPEDADPLSPLQPPLTSPEKKGKPWIFLVALFFAMVAIIDVGAYMSDAPKTRVFESNLCLQYYEANDPSQIGPDGNVPESLCKIDEVQQRLAMIFGWQDTFDAIPGMLLAVPFGALADRVGRKWIFAVSLVGLQLNCLWILLICYFRSLPLQWVWFSSAFFLVGGGPIVAIAIAMTMVSDVCPPEKRTNIFLYLTAAVLLSEMIAPVISSRMMEKGDWLPLLVSVGIQQIGVTAALICPETLHLRDLPEPTEDETDTIELRPKDEGLGIKAQLGHFKSAFLFMKSDTTIMLIIFTFFGNRLGRNAMTLLIRYASKRYNWEIKKAAYLLSFRAATNLVAVALFLPGVNYMLKRYMRFSTQLADIWLARGSVIVTSLSFLIMAAAAEPALLIIGLLVYNLGTGYNPAMRSVAVHAVGGQSSPDIGKLMSLLAITESIGLMLSGPLINELFQKGMDMGSAWLGLPFLGVSFMFGLLTLVTFLINVGSRDVEYVEVASEEEEDDAGLTNRFISSNPPLLDPQRTT
ncbi:MFS general substrate transporter [Periconia macrospinosa]|uniref:MFS general substrate transporter n=1 Tax=Periconia macrospinosa TaxID=97972 RepID=A0A2V1DFE3_9PLEO|nr:MFS general substrate transporter [Periconia macrospinosa]